MRWLFGGKTEAEVAAEKKMADEAALKTRAAYVEQAKANGKKFHDDAFTGDWTHQVAKQKTREQVVAEREAAKAKPAVKVEAKSAEKKLFAGFTEGLTHATGKNFLTPEKRDAVHKARAVRESSVGYKQAQLEAEKVRLAQEKADKERRTANEAEVMKSRAELLAHPKKAMAFNLDTGIDKPREKPELDLGPDYYNSDVAKVVMKMKQDPRYTASKEKNPLYRDLGFSRRSPEDVHYDMQAAKPYTGELGIFKARRAAALKSFETAQLHVDPTAPKMGR